MKQIEHHIHEGWLVIITDQSTYTVPDDYPMGMPCRPDGIPQVYDAPITKAFDLCLGDTIRHMGVEFIVTRVQQQGQTLTDVVITTVTSTGEIHRSRGNLYAPFTPLEDEVKPLVRDRERDEHPVRGPYVDPEREGVTYWFHVHPHGAGRWPADIPLFRREETPGEYTTRPPQQGKKKQAWAFLQFAGEDITMRHPYDPVIRRMQRASEWQVFRLARLEQR